VTNRASRVDALRRKKVAVAAGRIADAKRRTALMNSKVQLFCRVRSRSTLFITLCFRSTAPITRLPPPFSLYILVPSLNFNPSLKQAL
jgi:hypothetical protein